MTNQTNRPIRLITGLTFFCTELTPLCTELPENYIYLNQSELRNFSLYIIRAEIIRVISKLNERAARVQFEITSMI